MMALPQMLAHTLSKRRASESCRVGRLRSLLL